jgi:hypothetical protein
MQQDFTELQFIEGNQSIEIHSLGPNLRISHDWIWAQPLGNQAQAIRVFPRKRGLYYRLKYSSAAWIFYFSSLNTLHVS